MWSRLLAVTCLIFTVLANVEKTILIAPPATPVAQDASLDNLLLLAFTPDSLNARTYLNASFPSESNPKGLQTWALLEGLNPGQRYEFRICWLATQPTEFWIYTHTLEETFENPELISALSTYSHARHDVLSSVQIQALQSRRPKPEESSHTSMLFLQIYAAADYFTLNQSLMENVPPVHVDLILDPYLLNIFPQSLSKTAVYVVLVAVGAWLIAGYLSAWLSALISKSSAEASKKTN